MRKEYRGESNADVPGHNVEKTWKHWTTMKIHFRTEFDSSVLIWLLCLFPVSKSMCSLGSVPVKPPIAKRRATIPQRNGSQMQQREPKTYRGDRGELVQFRMLNWLVLANCRVHAVLICFSRVQFQHLKASAPISAHLSWPFAALRIVR